MSLEESNSCLPDANLIPHSQLVRISLPDSGPSCDTRLFGADYPQAVAPYIDEQHFRLTIERLNDRLVRHATSILPRLMVCMMLLSIVATGIIEWLVVAYPVQSVKNVFAGILLVLLPLVGELLFLLLLVRWAFQRVASLFADIEAILAEANAEITDAHWSLVRSVCSVVALVITFGRDVQHPGTEVVETERERLLRNCLWGMLLRSLGA